MYSRFGFQLLLHGREESSIIKCIEGWVGVVKNAPINLHRKIYIYPEELLEGSPMYYLYHNSVLSVVLCGLMQL